MGDSAILRTISPDRRISMVKDYIDTNDFTKEELLDMMDLSPSP